MPRRTKPAVKENGTDGDSNKKRRIQHQSPLTQAAAGQGEKKVETKKKNSNKQRRKSKQAKAEEEEERRLTALLFGGADDSGDGRSIPDLRDDAKPHSSKETKPSRKDEDDEDSSALFVIDRAGDEKNASSLEHEEETENKVAEVSKATNDILKRQSDSDEDSESDNEGNLANQQAAWVDEDDDQVEVDMLGTSRLRKLRSSRTEDQPLSGRELQQRLRDRYQTTMQVTAHTSWARVDATSPDDDDDSDRSTKDEVDAEVAELQSSSQPLLLQGGVSTSNRLPPGILNVVRCPDANQADYSQAVVQAVHFHPASDPDRPLLLTAGLDKALRFFQVGPEKSEKIHGIHFPKLPIHSASFLGDTGKVVVSGRRPFFYIYDSIAGKLDFVPRIVGREERSLEKCVPSPNGSMIAFFGNDGYVILVDVHSKHWIANLKMNGSVRAITFTPDGEYLLASGSDGDVYRWEIRTRRCVERFSNDDGTISSYLAASSRRHLAVGAESGVVNLYSDDDALRSFHRTPIKSIMNLQTSADMVRFNQDGQILAMSSRRDKHALKMLHVPTATVFSNWPTSKTPLGYVWSMDFSPKSKYMAVGNDKGKCLLYQLTHYNQ